jgi:tetratricopeptide (TPR) repeat protein
MAKIITKLITIPVIGLTTLLGSYAYGADQTDFDPSEIPDPQAVTAYKRFWDAFQDYEARKKKTTVEEYQRTRDGLESIYGSKDKEAIEKRIATLSNSIKNYNTNLEKTPTATNRPYVLLSLAQMHAEMASLMFDSGNTEESSRNRKAALDILKTIDQNHKTFAYQTDALYLRATLLEGAGETETSLTIWKKLSGTGSDRYTLHANIVVGDAEFENANPDKAILYYDRAKDLLSRIDETDKGLDELRIFYRLSWAHYKNANYEAAISAARRVISPGVLNKSVRQRERIARDLAELVGYALYEANNDKKTRDVIGSKDFQTLGAATSLVVIEQYLTAGLARKAEDIAEIAVGRFPLSREFPDLLRAKSRVEEKLAKKTSRLETLERLSMLLPAQSLWRQRHKDEADVIRYMESLAKGAAESVASAYYGDGLASGNQKKFAMAATHYGILLDADENGADSSKLRLKIANCQFFGGSLREAEKSYSELIALLKTPDDVLATAHYQRILTLEKIWRLSFETAVQRSIDPKSETSTLAALRNLELAVDEHSNKYPSQSRSVDLLLVAASANRDHNKFTDATKFWQRALLSNPDNGQRSIAIRGIVFAKIRSAKATEVIEASSNFLKLESDAALGQNLRSELQGVLTTAVNDESASLSKSGNADAASRLLLKVATDFSDLPAREQLWRDGAYFAGISGNWPLAQSSAQGYLKEGNSKFSGDMMYLLGRSHEYQLRFGEAVKNYIELGEKHPSHARSLVSLSRAEKLAAADDNYPLATKAAEIRADRVRDTAGKIAAIDSAISYAIQGNLHNDAMNLAQRRKTLSSSKIDKLESEFTLARVRYQSGDKRTALDDMDSIEKQIERSKFDLGDGYKRLSASVNMFLGEQSATRLRELRIDDGRADVSDQVDKKGQIFAETVTRLDKVAGMDQPDLSPKARFILAKASQEFADEINSIPARAGEPTTLKSQSRFNQNITRLREMSNRYHGNNILAKQRAPQQYAKNEWVSRSALALSDTPNADRDPTRPVDQLSTASSTEMPQQWSH